MSDDFERHVRDWLRERGRPDRAALETMAGYVAVLPPRRPDRRRPLAAAAVILVLITIAALAVPRFGQVGNVVEPSASVVPSASTSPSVPASTAPAGWAEPSNYAFVLESLCGERSLIGRFRLRVEGGARVEVAPIPPTHASGEDAPTLGELLAHVGEARAKGADQVVVTTDATDGHPTKVDIDWNANTIDDEECYRITDYVVLEPGATTQPTMGGTLPSPPPYALDLLGQLQCDAAPQQIGGEIGDVAPVGATGTASWGPWLDAVDDVDLPLTGWEEDPRTPWENGESNYVRFVNRVDGRVKAVIVMSGRSTQGGPGFWQVVAFRACQPAEFDALRGRTTDDAPWRDGTGAVTETVTTSAGPAHCGWESTVWLRYQGSLYLRDPLKLFAKVEAGAYSADATLPSGARDTGFRSVGRQLWVTDDPSFVWIRSGDRVERWPRSSEELGCA